MKQNNMNKYFILIFTFFFGISLFAQKNSRETRAVWVTTNFQLDWPPKTYDAEAQKKALIKIFDKIKFLKLNTVYFQVRSSGTVLFNSSYEGFPFYLTGSFNEKPSYDPLQFAINEAHKRGLQIHAWVNVMRCYANEASIDLENIKHLYNKKPEWIVSKRYGDKTQGWINPGIFNARAYLIDLFAEIIEKYDIDGLHLDFMRYPAKDFNDQKTYKKSESELDINDWRRENINKFLQVLYIRSKLIREDVKIGVTPIGIYKNKLDAAGMQGFYDVYQEAEKWLDEKYVDYIVPQTYWDLKKNPKFDILADDWKKRAGERKVILGIAAYKPEVKKEIKELIDVSRRKNSDGVAFFRYQNIADFNKPLFEHNLLPSEMPWLKSNMPYLNIKLKHLFLDKDKNLVKFEWNKNKDFLHGYYLLVKVTGNEFVMDDVVATVPSNKTSVILNIKKPKQFVYNFLLRAMDRLYNLSETKSNEVAVYPGKLKELRNINFEFVKPRLVKENDGKLKLLLNIKKSELIEVYQIKENNEILIFTEFINSGKNVIQLPDTNYSQLKIKHMSSKKEVKLWLK